MLFAYARVSTTEQAEDGAASIPEQLRKARALAAMRGVSATDIVDYVDAGVSGSVALSERPQGQDMLASARAGDCIVAAKLDRLFRSASDALTTAETLKAKGVDLILIDLGVDPVTANGTAKMFFGMLALMAEFERDRIRERTEEGRRGKRARQGFMGGAAPYGFAVIGEGREAKLQPIETEQQAISKARELRANNHGLNRIAKYLTKFHPTRSGKPWQPIQVQRLMRA